MFIFSLQKSKQVLEFYTGDMPVECKNQSESIDRAPFTEEEKRANLKKAITVDRSCRIIFPLAFLIFNVVYWSYYLHVSQYVIP